MPQNNHAPKGFPLGEQNSSAMRQEQKHNLDKERYLARKAAIIARLGGKCAICGSTERLEVDHRNRAEKKFDILNRMYASPQELEEELAKCDCLCHDCHLEKTVRERGQKLAKGTHGTLSSYRLCKCDLCREAHSAYCREWKRKNKLNRRRRFLRRQEKHNEDMHEMQDRKE